MNGTQEDSHSISGMSSSRLDPTPGPSGLCISPQRGHTSVGMSKVSCSTRSVPTSMRHVRTSVSSRRDLAECRNAASSRVVLEGIGCCLLVGLR